MEELIVNLHMHTYYSDGHASHAQIVQAAQRAGLDIVIVTDHNVLVNGIEGYYKDKNKQVLLLVGEEIHDQARDPQKNHLLVFGAGRELAVMAPDPQLLIDSVRQAGGLSFLAHPDDPAAPIFDETGISWVDWGVHGFTGLELWNAMSEFKSHLKSRLHAFIYAFNPRQIARGPFPETLQRWDELLNQGRKIVAIGGSDAHGLPVHLGPLQRTLFPYEFHFSSINSHLLVPQPLSDDLVEDRRMVLDAFRQGHVFIGYDLPASTRGFRFIGQGQDGTAQMGDEIAVQNGVTLQIHLPFRTQCRLMKNGRPIKRWRGQENCTYITSEPGVYRAEAYVQYLGSRRAWIISNPIYLR